MNIQEQIAAHKRENDEAIAQYAEEMHQLSRDYCVKHGGHFLTPWHSIMFNPIFKVASLEERLCPACGYTETRVPTYEALHAEVAGTGSSLIEVPSGIMITGDEGYYQEDDDTGDP